MVHLQDARRYVCNPDGVLSPSAVDSTDAILRALESDKGVETVVVAVKRLEGDDAYEFGMTLGRKYGIGSKTQRTGLIIILATEDRSYQILTGYGLEGTLPDAICRRIQNRVMLPFLKEGKWDAAIYETVKKIDGVVRGDELITADDDDGKAAGTAFGVAFGFAGLIIFIVLVAGYFDANRKCPRCKKRMLVVVKKRRIRKSDGHWRLSVTRRCKRCGYEQTDIEDDPEECIAAGTAGGVIFGSGGGFGDGGGGFGGGSFGGGSFGGGGSGGRF